jgi:shikimate kinase
MGSGKSTAGKGLAKKLGYQFIDLDEEIVKTHSKSITEIFETEGEQKFRELEKEELHKTTMYTNAVISAGGGTPCFFDNMDWMNENGTTVYLRMDPDELFSRLAIAREERPLIKDLSDKQLRDFITINVNKREVFYLKAKHTVRGFDLKIRALQELLSV